MSEKRILVGIYENGFPIHIPLNVGDTIVNASGREIATYNEQGLLPDNRLPPLAIKDTFVVLSELEMLNLVAEKGDIAIRVDLSKTFILKEGLPSDILNWLELATPIDSILTVFGRTGHISAEYGDYHATQITVSPSAVLNSPDVQAALEYLAVYKSQIDHTHVKSDITDFPHTHIKNEITDFEHTHLKEDITDFEHTHTLDELEDFENHTHIKSQIVDFYHEHEQSQSHLNVDTDQSLESIHHTLGTSEFQAAPGNHLHDPISIGAIPLSFMGTGNGVATLGVDGKLKDAQVPKIAITDVYPVNTLSEMIALNAEQGDIAIRLDIRKCFILKNDIPSVESNWLELIIPLDLILSFCGRTGHITSQYGDYSAEQISIQQYPPNIETTNVRDALYSLADKIHLPNRDRFIDDIPTKKLYIDSSNSEIYQPNGTITKPFKSFTSAISFANLNLYSKYSLIVSTGVYDENIILDNKNIDIIGNGNNTEIYGSISINGNSKIFISNLNIKGIFNNASEDVIVYNSKFSAIINSGNLVVYNSLITSNQVEDPVVNNTGVINIVNCTIINLGIKSAIVSSNDINIQVCNITGFNVFPLIKISSGKFYINGTKLFTNNTTTLLVYTCISGVLSSIDSYGNMDLNFNSNISIGVINRPNNSEILNDENSVYILDERYYKKEIIDFKLQTLADPDSNNIYVSKLGNDTFGNGSFALPFLTIKRAIDYITDASNLNRYTILVMSGRFTESDDFTFKDFVNIKGISKESTIITKLNNTPIEYNCQNTAMTIKDIKFGSTGIHITKVGTLRCDIKFESCMIEGYGMLRYIGKNIETDLSRDYLTVSQTCDFPHVSTQDVNFTCHHTIVNKTVTCKGYMHSYLLGVHIGQTLTVDCMAIQDSAYSRIYIDSPSMPNELNKLILLGITELHKHVIYLDQASSIYYDPTNNINISSKNIQQAVKTLDSLSHEKNRDHYLETQPTNILYVDCNRTDTYTSNGTITRPFKNINAAILVADNNTCIHIAPGLYIENLTCFNSIDLRGMGIRKVTIKGNVILNNQYNYLENIHINGNLYMNDISRIYKCDITGVTHMNIQNSYGYAEIHESILLSNSDQPPLKVHTFSTLSVLNSKISAKNSNSATIDHSYGILRLLNCYVYNNSPEKPVIDSHLDSIVSVLKIYNTEIIHELAENGEDAIYALNTADDSNPNTFSNILCRGNVRTEHTSTNVDGLIFEIYGDLFGSNHYFRTTNMISNKSNIPGVTLTDALNKISYICGYTRDPNPRDGQLFFDLNIQRPTWWNPIIQRWVDVHGNIVP